ncbi:MAG TPA: GatB/YqeY domain-containing protein, partial [Erythrobacter sp.]|nr:GatB/YqeY domain-containing protein [Erythrobacter sp.]
ITMYVDGGREELADQERAELAIIEEFLPQMMSADETRAAITAVKTDIGADSIKDMGRVMAELKTRHGAVLDMTIASALVKESLA